MKCLQQYCIIILLLLLASCSATKNLKEGQRLYDGAIIKLKNEEGAVVKNDSLLTVLHNLIRPLPNASLLGWKYKLAVYNMIDAPANGKGFWSKIKNKYGEPPVLANITSMEKNRQIIQNRLENIGYFKNIVVVDTLVKNKKLKTLYTASLEKPYTIRSYTFKKGEKGSVHQAIAMYFKEVASDSLGQPYTLQLIKNEREKIDAFLKQKGYYYFNPAYLIAIADSTVGNHQVDVTYTLSPTTPSVACEPFYIKNVVVFADYNIKESANFSLEDYKKSTQTKDSNQYLWVVDAEKKIKPQLFQQVLGFKKNPLYNRLDHSLALNRLTNLGTFKFVRANFSEIEKTDNDTAHWLNAYYFLTPAPAKSFRFEVAGFTKSNSSNGGELSLNWRHRNLFKGAEKLSSKLYISIEQQNLKGAFPIKTHKFGGELSLELPHIIGPYKFGASKDFLPKTLITLGAEKFIRTDQYSLNSINVNYAYIWKNDFLSEHKLDVVNFVVVKPANIEPSFKQQLDTNIILRRSIEEQFIIGMIHNYTYTSNPLGKSKKNQIYVNSNLDFSGNIMGLLSKADVRNGRQIQILKTPFAQYIRGEIDFRHYLTLTPTLKLATRTLLGAGYAYGNSFTLPFVKSFFAGGPNDNRGFAIRSLGPGLYYAGNPKLNGYYTGDQPGEMKMLLSTELRKKIGSYFEAAFFVDMGNVWLLKNDPSRIGGAFSKNFYQQVAISAGPCLRLDFGILLIRMDVGIPIRGPHDYINSFEWKAKDFSYHWLKNNTILNLAIGYPF